MAFSRRNVLKMGVALAAAPLAGDLGFTSKAEKFFSTGSPELDGELGGGMKSGSFLAVVGPRGCGKTSFFLRLGKANGIVDSYSMRAGTSDMLSIMERQDGRFIGSLMLDAAEPSTDREKAGMQAGAAARDAFLARWFERTREVTHESGGLFAISVCQSAEIAVNAAWLKIPDYVIAVSGPTARLIGRA
jgi:hypothetical protein